MVTSVFVLEFLKNYWDREWLLQLVGKIYQNKLIILCSLACIQFTCIQVKKKIPLTAETEVQSGKRSQNWYCLHACITLASSVNSSEEGNLGWCPFFHFSSFKLDALLCRDHRPSSLDELLDWSEAKLQLLCWLRSSVGGKKETTFSTTKKNIKRNFHFILWRRICLLSKRANHEQTMSKHK